MEKIWTLKITGEDYETMMLALATLLCEEKRKINEKKENELTLADYERIVKIREIISNLKICKRYNE